MDQAALEAVAGNVRPDTFLTHWRAIRDAKNDQADKGSATARAKKAAKRDGVDLEVLSWLEKLDKLSQDERELMLRKLFVYSDWLSMPLAAAAEGLSPPPQPKNSTMKDFFEWQAGQDGYKAGKSGSKRDENPHQPGSAEHVAWDKRWAAGFRLVQNRRADALAKNAGVAKRAKRANGEARAH